MSEKSKPGPEAKKKPAFHGTATEHESFGLLGVSRLANSHGHRLFGSSVQHSNTIRLRISQAEEHRSNLHYDSYRATNMLIEVELSLAQFGEAMFGAGSGDGVPCTIRRIEGRLLSDPPFESKRDQFADEFKEQMNLLTQRMNELQKLAKSLLDQKTPLKKDEKDSLRDAIFEMCRIPEDNMPFFAKMFNEQMDKTVHQAKMEFDAHVQNKATQLGLEAMATAPKLVTDKDEE